MENCFITTFKGDSDNNNLPKFDTIVFKPYTVSGGSQSNQTQRIRVELVGGANTNAKAIGTGSIGTTYSSTASGYSDHVDNFNAALFASYNDFEVDYTGLYNIGYLQLGKYIGFNIDQLDFKGCAITNFSSQSPNDGLVGNIQSFRHAINATTITIGTYARVVGTIESLVEGQAADGRNSGTMTLNVGGTQGITLDGNRFTTTTPYCHCVFSATDVKVYKSSSATPGASGEVLIKTYNITTHTWS